MENYYQSLGEASQQHQSLNEASASASSTLNEKLDREREALMLFGEPLVGHSIVENVVNLSKAGALKGAKALESRGIVPEGTTENIGRIASDFQEGGLKRVLKTQYNKQLNRVGNRGTVDNTPLPEDKAVELPDFEPQLTPISLPPPPPPRPTSLPPTVDDLLQNKAGARSLNVEDQLPFTRSNVSVSGGYSDPFSIDDIRPAVSDSIGSASSNVSSSLAQVKNSRFSLIGEDEPFSTPTTLGRTITSKVGNNVEKGMKAVEGGVEKAVSTDAELGGPTDVVGDLASLGVGLATSIGGIFGIKHKEISIDQSNYLNPSLQLGIH